MEDAHCAVEETFKVTKNIPIINNNSNLGKEPKLRLETHEETINVKIFGVFDGHGGWKSAKFVSECLPRLIIDEIKVNYQPNKPNNWVKMLKNGFMRCDHDLYHKHFQCGTTSIVVVIINNSQMYVCNTGDSRCVMSTGKGGVKNLSFDHKPSNIGELIRIQDAGGVVNMNRVNASLALSRAFGDFNFKKKKVYIKENSSKVPSHFGLKEIWLPSEETQVTVEPEIIELKLDYERDEFLVLGCDGIWDSFRNSTLIQLIRHKISIGVKLDKICEDVIDKILQTIDSNTGVGFDNMTILVVAIHGGEISFDGWYRKIQNRYENEMGIV